MSPENEPMEGPQPAPAVTIRQFLSIVADRELREQVGVFFSLPASQQETIWASLLDELDIE